MAVQFLCPSCEHPIEIDDEWAAHSVACPFCRNTVTAPASSTYVPTDAAPYARPLDNTQFPQHPGADTAAAGNRPAAFALGLSLLHLIAFFGTSAILGRRMVDAVGDDPDPAEAQRYLQEQVQGGDIPDWLAPIMMLMILSLALWVGGLICAIFGVRRPTRRRLALVAFALLAVTPLMFCLGVIQMAG